VAGLLVAALLLVLARPAAAATDGPGAVRLLPAPGSQLDDGRGGYAVRAQPGGGVWQSVVVENTTSATTLTVELAGAGDAGAWLHPSSGALVLAPRQRERVAFTIAPPADARSGAMTGALTARVVDAADARDAALVGTTTEVGVTIDVLGTGSGASSPAPAGAPPRVAGPQPAAPTEKGSSNTDVVTLVAVVGVLALLVAMMFVPPAVRWLRAFRRRARSPRMVLTGMVERARGRRLRARAARVADHAAVAGTAASVAPATLSRADERRAAHQRRVAERRARLAAEREQVREAARRASAEAWDARLRDLRERTEAEAFERAQAIEAARRARAEHAATLVAERRAAEERRLREVREAQARRREEIAERARQRAAEFATRRQLDREADATLRRDVVADELRRHHETELSRAEVVQLRSEEARELARSAIVRARALPFASIPAPLPCEFGPATPSLVEPPATAVDAREPVERPDDADPRDVEVVGTGPNGGPGRGNGRVAVTALDVDALNELLQRGA
jgi:hypothetical protein